MSSEWRSARLGEVADILCGFAFPTAQMCHDANAPRILSGANVRFGDVEWRPDRRWRRSDSDGFDRFELAEGDIVVGMNRPVVAGGLKHAVIRSDDLPALLFQRVARIRGTRKLDSAFARFILGSRDFRDHVVRVSTGSTLPVILERHLLEYEFSLPSVLEQRRIAGVLGALDDKIAHNARLGDRLVELAGLRFRAAFVLDDVPRAPLATFVSLIRATVSPTEQPDEEFEYFSIPAFDGGRRPELVRGASILSGKTVLPEGDAILFSKLNPLTARVWWARPSGQGRPVCSSEFLVLAPGVVPVSFLYAGLRNDPIFYEEVLGHVTGTTGSRQRIRPADALRCSFPAPAPADVAAFDAFARPLYDLEATLHRESTRLAAIRDILLPKLVSGRVRVPASYDPDDVLGTVAEEAIGALP
jgi:type I restriction enzyme S subunit